MFATTERHSRLADFVAIACPFGLDALQASARPAATICASCSVLIDSMASSLVGARSCACSVGVPRAWFNHAISAFAAARSPLPADWQSSRTALSTFAASATRASATTALVPSF